jgi:hypothetical protein
LGRFGSFSAAGAKSGPVARLGFLGASPIGRESTRFGDWKSLDFLGFSRPKLDFSMGYDEFSLNEISLALLSAAASAPEQARASLACRNAEMVMGGV